MACSLAVDDPRPTQTSARPSCTLGVAGSSPARSIRNPAGNGGLLVAQIRDGNIRIGQNVYVLATATCECRRIGRHLALIEEAIEAVREAERLLPEGERLREEERLLLDLRTRIEERLAVLAA